MNIGDQIIPESDPLVQELLDNKKVKPCPNCTIYIEKIDGCEYVNCSYCKCEFCFLCGFAKNFDKISAAATTRCADKTHNSHS